MVLKLFETFPKDCELILALFHFLFIVFCSKSGLGFGCSFSSFELQYQTCCDSCFDSKLNASFEMIQLTFHLLWVSAFITNWEIGKVLIYHVLNYLSGKIAFFQSGILLYYLGSIWKKLIFFKWNSEIIQIHKRELCTVCLFCLIFLLFI